MAAALRSAILRHLRLPAQAQSLTIDRSAPILSSLMNRIRSMSSHGDEHLTREEVVERVLDVVKSFPKVDPSKVWRKPLFRPSLFLFSFHINWVNFLIFAQLITEIVLICAQT